MEKIDYNQFKVKPVTPKNWEDMEFFFEQKGGPSYCWCMYLRMNEEQRKIDSKKNRKKWMKDLVISHTHVGLLLYYDNKPIAWCSIAPEETYKEKNLNKRNLENVWALRCIHIISKWRRKGLAGFLIEEAKKYSKENGGDWIEATPVEKDSPSYQHMGYVDMYKKAGFKEVATVGKRRHVMIYNLNPSKNK